MTKNGQTFNLMKLQRTLHAKQNHHKKKQSLQVPSPVLLSGAGDVLFDLIYS